MLIFLLAAGAGTPVAEQYLPLTVGWEWFYESDMGETDHMSMLGERVVLGVLTTVRREEYSTQSVENFWSVGEDGDLYLHAAVNYTFQIEFAYAPPILVLDAPLEIGKSWSTENIQVLDLSGNPLGMSVSYHGQVVGHGPIEVPAGCYSAWSVLGETLPGQVIGGSLAVLANGRAFQGNGKEATCEAVVTWYVDGVGVVRFRVQGTQDGTFDLQWWNPAVPVRSGSWGEIKGLFR